MKKEEVSISSFLKKDGNLIKILHRSIDNKNGKVYSDKHTEMEIMFLKSGYGKVKTSCGEFSLIPGDICIFRNNENHCIELTDKDSTVDTVSLLISPKIIMDYNILQCFADKEHKIHNRLDRENPMIEKIRQLILEIEHEFTGEHSDYSLMVKNMVETIFILLTRHFFEAVEGKLSLTGKTNFGSIEDSMDYIDEHLTDPLKLEDLALVANMSKTYYTTIFKKLKGISPWEYIISKRIDLAISLMKENNMTILELALKSGFNSTANFNRAFKRCTGKTPTEFRAEMNII